MTRNPGEDQRLADLAFRHIGCERVRIEEEHDTPTVRWLRAVQARAEEQADRFAASEYCLRPMPRVIFGYTYDPGINACAFRFPDVTGLYYVAINGEAQALTMLAFNRLLAQPGIFPDIGDHQIEVDGLPPFRTESDGTALALSEQAPPAFPRCATRRSAARGLADLALYFLSSHEFRHIHAGHVDYLSSGFGMRAVSECADVVLKPNQYRVLQSIEMDADMFGITPPFHLVFDGVGGGGLAKAFCPTLEAGIRNLLRLCYVLWRSMGSGSAEASLTMMQHPTPAIRFHLMVTKLSELVQRLYPALPRDLVPRTFVEVLGETEEAYAAVCDIHKRVEGGLQATSPEGMERIGDILAHWGRIRDELVPFSYVRLPVPTP